MPTGNRGRPHVIDDIHYEPDNGPSWLVCGRDGTRLDAPSPGALAALWARHGGQAQRSDGESRVTVAAKPIGMCPEKGCELKHARYGGRGGCTVHPWHKVPTGGRDG